MNNTNRQKKWLKLLAWIIASLLVLATVLYYTIAFRFKETVQLIVDKESGGLYAFNASKVDVSLLENFIAIKNARLTCKDTAATTPHYDVQIPDIFLSVHSIKQMLIGGRLAIDSLSIAFPELKIHEHTQKSGSHAAFHVSKIFDVLQTLKSHLQIKSFSIHRASFDYNNVHNPAPFSSNQISLVVKNFSRDNHPDSSFLSSDDVDLSILKQHWKLPDGLHEVRFSNLHFSGSNQLFEIDSCIFKGKDKKDNMFSISADKLFFNSTQLAALYNDESLIIDTLILYKPVIALEAPKEKKTTDTSTHLITQSLKNIFKLIHFKFIDIKNGSLQLTYKNDLQPAFASHETHLKVYNLLLAEDSADISIDSIALQQKNISLITKDSLFKLNIEEFAIQNNTVLLRNASYLPTEKNHNSKVFTFRSPLLKLSNVNLEDLAAKRFTASAAELYEPEIDFKTDQIKKRSRSNKNIDKFYTVLNGLSELVNVKNFRIIRGNLNFKSSGADALQVRAENINMQVLLPQLFSSDSLIDIKRALPVVSVGRLKLQSPKVRLEVNDFGFKGAVGYNHAAAFDLALANGTQLRGRDLTWIVFDWDKYRQQKQFEVNSMRIGELAVHTQKKKETEKGHVAKDLPVIHLDRIHIDRFSFDQHVDNATIFFTGQKFWANNIHSLKQLFTWDGAGASINNIAISNTKLHAKIDSVHLTTNAATTIHNATIELKNNPGHVNISVPSIETELRLQSSDFSQLHFATLNILSPVVQVTKQPDANNQSSAHKMPDADQKNLTVSVGKMQVLQASVFYKENNTEIKTGFEINAEGIQHFNDPAKLLSWQQFRLNLNAMELNKANTRLSIPAMSIDLKNGNISRLEKHYETNTELAASWSDAGFRNHKTDSNFLEVEKVSGVINKHSFSFSSKEKFSPEQLLDYLSVKAQALTQKSPKTTLSVNDIRYDGASQSLNAGSFTLAPNMDAANLFKNAGWQTSHTSLATGRLQVSGINPAAYFKDSVIRAGHVHIVDMKLTTIKDKRYPFKHGLEKPMLAQLINNLKIPMHIDSLQLENGSIYVNETTEKTHKEAIVPLENIHALATHIKNRNNEQDSLAIDASLQLYSTRAHHFRYREAYGDSLSAFTLKLGVSPITLPELSLLTMPFANVNVVSGKADTLFSNWAGNKYAAVGTMNFIYDNLKIQLMSKKDSTRSTLLERIGSFLANDIALHRKNDQPAFIFYVRDPEKSVFNYWVHTKLNGVLGSAAILQRKKHYKEYMKHRAKYRLPDITY